MAEGVIDGRMDEPGSPSVGARCVSTRSIGLAARPVISEIACIEALRTRGCAGIDGPIRAIVDATAEPSATPPSRLTIAIDFEGGGIGTILVLLLVRREARKEMPANLAALKRRLEVRHRPRR